MDSEVQENNVHEQLSELFKLSFGAQYVRHRTTLNFSDSMLRSMKTAEIQLDLQIDRSLDITTNAYHSWVQETLGSEFFVYQSGLEVEVDSNFTFAVFSIVVDGSSNEQVIETISSRLEEVKRKTYDKSFNRDLEVVLDENCKVR